MTSLLLEHFSYAHLPQNLQATSIPFAVIARQLDQLHANNPEKSTALRKLLEAKDAAVRSAIFTQQKETITPPTYPILAYFTHEHLAEPLKSTSKPFCKLANELADEHAPNEELNTVFRKLLEAKDAAVRSIIFTTETRAPAPDQNGDATKQDNSENKPAGSAAQQQ